MAYQRGTCPTCGRRFAVNTKGELRPHSARNTDGQITGGYCRSIGKPSVEAGGAPASCGYCGEILRVRGPHLCASDPANCPACGHHRSGMVAGTCTAFVPYPGGDRLAGMCDCDCYKAIHGHSMFDEIKAAVLAAHKERPNTSEEQT